MSEFRVSGRIELVGGATVSQEAKKVETALRGVGTASAQVNASAAAAARTIDQEAASLGKAATAAKGQAAASAQVNASAAAAARTLDQETVALGKATAATKAKASADQEAARAAEGLAGAKRNVPATPATPPATPAAPATPRTPAATPPTTPPANDNARRPLTAAQSTALFQQGSDVVAQLAGGQNPLLIAIQQGPQLMQAFGNSAKAMASGIMTSLRAIPPQAVAVAAAIGLTVAPLAIGVSHAQQLNRELRQTDIVLRATAQSAGLTAREIQSAVTAELGRPGAGRDETFASSQRLLANPLLSGDAFGRTLAVARDFARVTGAELPQAAEALASALDGTQGSVSKLDQVFRVLTIGELQQIRTMELTGDRAGVVAVALSALERRFKGLNEDGVGPTDKATAQLRASWERFKDSLADGWVIRSATAGLQGLLTTAQGVIRWGLDQVSGGSGTPANDPVATAKQQLAAAQAQHEALAKQLLDLQRRRDAAGPGRQGYILDTEISAARDKLRRAQDDLQKHSAAVQKAEAEVAAARDKGSRESQTAADREALAAAERAATSVNRRQQIDAEIQQQERLLRNEQLTAERRASIQQHLQQLRGERATLETPAEQIDRELAAAQRLAALPEHLRAAEQAYQDTFRRMLTATGDVAKATAAAVTARDTVLREAQTATREQVQALDDEAAAALRVASAYGRSAAEAMRLRAQLAAQSAERRGEIAPGTAGQAATAQLQRDAATAVEAAAQRNDAMRLEVEGLGQVAEAERVSSEAAREAARANDVATMSYQLMAQAAASGNPRIIAAAREQIAVYDQLTRERLARQRQGDAAQFNRQYDPEAAFRDSMARLEELKRTGILTARAVAEATREYELQRLEASRDATDGMIAGLRRYADEALSFGRAAGDGIAQGMRAGEDAIVSLATTGRISFSNLANSIIADLARIAVRQGVTGPISQGLSWVLGQIGSGEKPKTAEGGSGVGGGGGGILGWIGNLVGRIFHEGGVVGEGGRASRPLPAALWAGARRYHGGGPVLGPGEVPIIAMRGEEVLPASHPRHRDNAGRGGPAVVVNVINNGDAKVATRQREAGDGSMTVDVLIDAVETGMARNVAAGRGALHQAISSTFDIADRGRR